MATQRPHALKMSLPAATELVRPVRLAVGGLASIGDFSVESVEELQLAANELLVVLMGCVGDAQLDLDIELKSDGAFCMNVSAKHPNGQTEPDVIAVSERILSVMADEYHLNINADVASGGFVRHPDVWADEDLDRLATFD